MPKTILFVHRGGPWIRGSEVVLIDLISGIGQGGRFRPIVWCNESVLASAVSESGIHVHMSPTQIPFHPRRGRWSVRAFWTQLRQAIRYIRLHDVALIHCNNIESMQWMIPAARYTGIPLLCHVHMLYGALERSLYLLHRADFLVGCSRATMQGLVEDGFPITRIQTIYNGVRLPAPNGHPRYGRERLGIKAAEPVIAVVGALEQYKGVDSAIEAVRHLHARGIAVHLLVIGEGRAAADLRAMSQQIGGGHYVHFLGQMPRYEVAAILSAAVDVTVVPSRYEALSLAALEAQAAGVPVVGSDIGGIREAIADGDTGLIFPADDPIELATAVEYLLVSPAVRLAMGAAGRKRISESFSIDQMVERFTAIYEELLDIDWASKRVAAPVLISSRALAKAASRAISKSRK